MGVDPATAASNAASEGRASERATEEAPRTLLITERYLPEVGGSFVWFTNTYRRFPAGTVWIVTRRYPGASAVDAGFPRIHTTRLALRRWPFLRPESLALIVKLVVASLWLVWRGSIRIIHAGKFLPEGIAARIVSRMTGVPYVVYAHGEELTVVLNNSAYGRHFARLRAVYNDAAAVIANSDFTRDQLVRFGVDPRRIVRISPGVDPSVFTPGPADPDLLRRYDLDGKLVLLSVGRLQKRKGHDHVLRALPTVLAHRPDLVYVIVSTGKEEAALRALARDLGIESHVRFVGEVPLEIIPRWYRSCDIFILANRTIEDGDAEGFGIVFLEAGACGKPVIAGMSGGTADSVKGGLTGLRIDASSPELVADAILELANDPALRRRMGDSARATIQAEHGWQAVSDKIRGLSNAAVNR